MKLEFSNAESVGEPQKLPGLITYNDSLVNGIWPRSFAIWMTVFYVALFIIRPWEKLAPELATIRFERISAILMIVVVFASGRFKVHFDFQTVTILLFTGALCLSGMFAGGLSLPYVFLTLVVFYLVLTSVIRTPYELVFMIACYLVIMAVYLGKSQWEYFVHGAGLTEMGVRRLQGVDSTFGNDNALANSVIYSLPMLYFLYQVRHEFCVTWPGFWQKWFVRGLAAYALLATTSIFLTRSRMGIVALVVFMVLLAMRRGSFLSKLAGALMVLVFCIGTYFVLPTDMQGRIESLWKSSDANSSANNESAHLSAEGRRQGLLAGIAMFKDHPIFGVGVENFGSYREAHVDGSTQAAHNLAGELLGKTGLAGVGTFALLVAATLINSYRVQRLARFSNGQPRPLAMAQLAPACRDLVILLFFTGLSTHNLERFNWLWAGAFCTLALEFCIAALDDEIS